MIMYYCSIFLIYDDIDFPTMWSVFIFFTVTKQRDPETGQQSLLFQVGWSLNLQNLLVFAKQEALLKKYKASSHR